MNLTQKTRIVRRSISIMSALLLAAVMEWYLALSHDFIIPITAIFVMLAPVGNLVYQGLRRLGVLIIIIVLLSLILPPHHMVYARLGDAGLGAMVGILANLFILPRQADTEFRCLVLPILRAAEEYFAEIINSIFEKDERTLNLKKMRMELLLQNLPSWVYESGFDLGLREGYQYFLMKLLHIVEILFSLHHAVRCHFDEEVRKEMRESVFVCADKIKIFFVALSTVFELKKLKEGVEDFEPQLHELDLKFQELMPVSVDILSIPRDDVAFYAIIYGLDDLRKALIKLGQALR